MQTVLRLRVRVDTQRTRPLLDGYRAALFFGEYTDDGRWIIHDAWVVWEDTLSAAPGEEHLARAWVAYGDLLPDGTGPGTELNFLEPPHPRDHVTILDVLADDTPFPLRDEADAKVRPLKRA